MTEIRRLGPGDEALVERLATREPRTALLHEPSAILLVALRHRVTVAARQLVREDEADRLALLYESVGGTRQEVVQWDFDYTDA